MMLSHHGRRRRRCHTIHALESASHVVVQTIGPVPERSIGVARHPDLGQTVRYNAGLQRLIFHQIGLEGVFTECLNGQIQGSVHCLMEESVVPCHILPSFTGKVRFHPRGYKTLFNVHALALVPTVVVRTTPFGAVSWGEVWCGVFKAWSGKRQ